MKLIRHSVKASRRASAQYLLRRRVDERQVILESLRDGVCQSTDSSRVGLLDCVLAEVRIEESIRLADWHIDTQPIASRGYLVGGDVVLAQP